MSNQIQEISAVRAALSHARIATYEAAAGRQDLDDPAALLLYGWNAEVSGALLSPLHVCEVVIRNAVTEALEKLYGARWPWSQTFVQSLPNTSKGYSPRQDLLSARRNAQTAGQVIPELKFVFWQKMFTSRYDVRIWVPHLFQVMPNLDTTQPVAASRQSVYQDLERVRLLRNRIAHHEPIFARQLNDDYQTIHRLITYRCTTTAAWLNAIQKATATITNRPTGTRPWPAPHTRLPI
ncbi:hypothetical protein [Aeromonas taiwanensis]